MNDQRDPNDPADDLEGFDSFEEPMDDQMLEDEPLDDAALDADFQDLPEDEIDADVFGEGEPAEAPAKKKTNWFNIGVAVVAIVVAGGLVWSKLGPSLLGNANAPAPMAINQDNLVRSPNDANEAAQAALSPAANAPAVQGGLLDDPEKFSTLAQNSQPVDVPGPAHRPVGNFAPASRISPGRPANRPGRPVHWQQATRQPAPLHWRRSVTGPGYPG